MHSLPRPCHSSTHRLPPACYPQQDLVERRKQGGAKQAGAGEVDEVEDEDMEEGDEGDDVADDTPLPDAGPCE